MKMDGDEVDEELLSILLNGDIQTFWSRFVDGSSISKYISEASTFIMSFVHAMRFVVLVGHHE